MMKPADMVRWLLLCLVPCWACDNVENSEPEETTAPSNGETDDETDSGEETISPYDAVDCNGRGQTPAHCEYEICAKREFHHTELACADTSDVCRARADCYDDWMNCMTVACPPGTPAPTTRDERREAGFYACDNEFSTCMLYATP